MSKTTPTFFKIVFTDYMCFMYALFSILFILLGPGVILIWLFSIPMLLVRYGMIKKAFQNENRIKGKLTKRDFFRHGVSLKYSFNVEGQNYEVGNFVKKYSLAEQVGDSVEIVYQTANPKKAFIAKLYES